MTDAYCQHAVGDAEFSNERRDGRSLVEEIREPRWLSSGSTSTAAVRDERWHLDATKEVW